MSAQPPDAPRYRRRTAPPPEQPHVDPQDTFINAYRSRKLIFLVGAGISAAPPANLDMGTALVERTIQHHLPSDIASMLLNLNIHERIQPEVFFQELAAFRGAAALNELAALRTEKARPTVAHYVLCLLAEACWKPLLTVNFDSLLERAADDLGLPFASRDLTNGFRPPRERLEIWHLHGVLDPGRDQATPLSATLRRTTAPNREFLAWVREEDCTLALIAYSGRDLDIYPWLREVSPAQPKLWFDIAWSQSSRWAEALHIRRGDIEAIAIEARIEEFVQRVSLFEPSLRRLMDRSRHRARSPLGPPGSVPVRRDPQGAKPLGHSQAAIFAGLALQRTPARKEATTLLQSGLESQRDPWLACRAHLGLWWQYDLLSDYPRALHEAKAAHQWSKRVGSQKPTRKIALRIASIHALQLARKMMLGPRLSPLYGEVATRPKLLPYLVAVGRLAHSTHRMKRSIDRLEDTDPGHDPEWSESWRALAWNRYLDHRLIELAVYQGIGETLQGVVGPVGRAILRTVRRTHDRLTSLAWKEGDAETVAHVQKQIALKGEQAQADIALSLHAYDLLVDPVNEGLVHRARAEAALRRGDLATALRRFARFLELARDSGNEANRLKALAGLFVAGGRLDEEELLALQEHFAGTRYALTVEKLIKLNRRSSDRLEGRR